MREIKVDSGQIKTGEKGQTTDSLSPKSPIKPAAKLADPKRIEIKGIQIHLDKIIGQGGYGVLFAGTQIGTGRSCVVKVLKKLSESGDDVAMRFKQECDILVSLQKEKTRFFPDVYDYGEIPASMISDLIPEDQPAYPFIAMEMIEGKTLSHMKFADGKERVAQIEKLFKQALEGLAVAHALGITNRDVKPDNIIVRPDQTICILDWGIAKSRASAVHTITGTIMGSFSYSHPRQLQGDPDAQPHWDLFSAAAAFYELLTYKLPYRIATPKNFAEATKAALERKRLDRVALRKELLKCGTSKRAAEVIANCLTNKGEIYKDARDALRALNRKSNSPVFFYVAVATLLAAAGVAAYVGYEQYKKSQIHSDMYPPSAQANPALASAVNHSDKPVGEHSNNAEDSNNIAKSANQDIADDKHNPIAKENSQQLASDADQRQAQKVNDGAQKNATETEESFLNQFVAAADHLQFAECSRLLKEHEDSLALSKNYQAAKAEFDALITGDTSIKPQFLPKAFETVANKIAAVRNQTGMNIVNTMTEWKKSLDCQIPERRDGVAEIVTTSVSKTDLEVVVPQITIKGFSGTLRIRCSVSPQPKEEQYAFGITLLTSAPIANETGALAKTIILQDGLAVIERVNGKQVIKKTTFNAGEIEITVIPCGDHSIIALGEQLCAIGQKFESFQFVLRNARVLISKMEVF